MPSTKGSNIGLSSQSSATTAASAVTQNTMLLSNRIALMPGAERVHVPYPFGEIKSDRQQRQQRHRGQGQSRHKAEFKAESLLGQDQNGEQDLRHGVGFRHQ